MVRTSRRKFGGANASTISEFCDHLCSKVFDSVVAGPRYATSLTQPWDDLASHK